MEKKKEIVLGLLLLVACCAFADRYKVLYLNSSDIRIANKTAAVGSIFDDRETINWTSDQQAMKVVNLNTNRVMVFAAKALKKKKASSLYEYLTGNKHLSTRSLSPRNREEWQLDTTLYLLDTLYLHVPSKRQQSAKTKIVFRQGGEMPLSVKGNRYVITRSLFGRQMSRPIRADIIEYDRSKDWSYTVYRNLLIELLPSSSR